ncbi:MAG TPA: LLM class flavin-dependent oxidoreductase [Microbacteriaceae bacterium]|nr:LLM class flavin-dependent oxidoreductase [Microbacteriaceae bacterium]
MKFTLLIEGTARRGVSVHQLYNEAVELIDAAEELGFDAFGCSEQHFWPQVGDIPPIATIPTPELLYAYAARNTKRLTIRTAVSVLPLRPPLLVAEQVASLDILSGGRMQFGTGRGNSTTASDAYGIPTDETYERWEESIKLILEAWTTEGEFSWEGKYYSVPPLHFQPKPLQKPHPKLFYAALSPQSHQLAGDLGMSLLTGTAGVTLEKLSRRIEMYRQAFRNRSNTIGYTPEESVSLTVLANCTEDEATAKAQSEQAFIDYFTSATSVYSTTVHRLDSHVDFSKIREQYTYDRMRETVMVIAGTPDTWTQQLGRLVDVGVDEVTVNFGAMEHQDTLSAMALLSSEVMPKFR